jgi:hypothetical protein
VLAVNQYNRLQAAVTIAQREGWEVWQVRNFAPDLVTIPPCSFSVEHGQIWLQEGLPLETQADHIIGILARLPAPVVQ